ncbi:MAG TPA: vWA domain-containing protein [Pyrinomonadaceae bacterium]|nr:vWA domain-containing protein [Pyrinomonadaceae bacterium]
MNSLPVKILTAILTFAIGVGIASLWLARWFNPVIEPVAVQQPAARLEMVFVLDTTGSMGALIEGAKQRIWGIVNEVMQESHTSVRIGLVAYRDRGDEYVTQVLPLTSDLDKVYTTLMDYHAVGGGDEAEDVRTALSEAVYKVSWSPASSDLAQIVFLVGDAPPHNDYRNTTDTLTTTANAVQRGIIVNTIQCGTMGETTRAWQAIAERGNGEYFAIADNGGVQTISTPYDEQMGNLATQLGATFMSYGFGAGPGGLARRAEVKRAADEAEGRITYALPEAKAERALNKVANKEAYIGDLLQSIENGSVKLESINPVDLPEELQNMDPAQRTTEVEKRLVQRREIRAWILELSKQREAFIDAERKKLNSKEEGFDTVVSKTLKAQMARKKSK